MAVLPTRAELVVRCLLLGVATVIASAALASGAWTPSAEAHAAFLEAEPSPGARLDSAPRRMVLEFTEPLNRALTKATLIEVGSGKEIPATLGGETNRELVLRPRARLGRAAYRVDWHTVSTEDGHALEGSFSFGVGTPAVGAAQELEQSPLARGGWLRMVLRTALYASLFFFAGGIFVGAVLSRREGPAAWLAPEELHPSAFREATDGAHVADRAWRRTLDAGWIAAGAAAAVAAAEAADASGGLSAQGAADFLLSNVAGLGRALTVLALLAAVLSANRSVVMGAGWSAMAFLAIAVSGHANSAEPRSVAVITDWVHLVAGAVWLGGIAQIGATWLLFVRRRPAEVRRELMSTVLKRFGTLALPAFLAVVATGSVSALIQLGAPEALWQTAYGRVLALKIVLVGLIGGASYWHAMRLRPRLLAVHRHDHERLERRHWRLLGAEPAGALGVLIVAAALVTFPLPPRQLSEAGDALASVPPCDPCPLERPRANELAVAEQAGSSIAAVWLRRAGGELVGTLRVLGRDLKPVPRAAIPGAALEGCGRGCWNFRLRGEPRELVVQVPEAGRLYSARLPARWHAGEGRRARRLLERAQTTMRELRSVREVEHVTSGPVGFALTRYRLQAPDRLAYRTNLGTESITIGERAWTRYDQGSPWQEGRFAGGGPRFRTRTWFRWTPYARAARLLSVRRRQGRRLAELALMDHGTPVWTRLTVDLESARVLRSRVITDSHFQTQRLLAFNGPVSIRPPRKAGDGR